ncbi:TlpA family protein disulfide reductase [Pendulispora albinea]|uniref:TlpA family protein disulfide reductase n=1 Tax=Pendulispora albinea TaxID=2741071 RepID=A0ABZ2M6A7_9BACT
MRAPRVAVAVLAFLLGGCALGCGSEKASTPVGVSQVPVAPDKPPPIFQYASLDGRPVSSAAMRGRLAVIAFITTWDLASQAQVDFLVAMAKNDGDRVAYALVTLQERRDRELIEMYRSKLGVTFPVALADAETIAGGGPFGDVHSVPTVVVLGRDGRILWRNVGLARSDEIRREMRGR